MTVRQPGPGKSVKNREAKPALITFLCVTLESRIYSFLFLCFRRVYKTGLCLRHCGRARDPEALPDVHRHCPGQDQQGGAVPPQPLRRRGCPESPLGTEVAGTEKGDTGAEINKKHMQKMLLGAAAFIYFRPHLFPIFGRLYIHSECFGVSRSNNRIGICSVFSPYHADLDPCLNLSKLHHDCRFSSS